MRTAVIYLVLAAATAASAGCLHNTEFKCRFDADCGATGACESVGYCSVPNSDCAGTGRSFGESAGQGLSNTCVPGSNPGLDAGIDAPTDGPPNAGCPSGYAAVAGSAHRYKALTNVSWDEAKNACKLTSASAYLAVPDDLTELMNLATAATAAPFWIGIDDQRDQGMFVTQKNVPATFLPWKPGQPGGQPEGCVDAVSTTEIAADKCNMKHAAVCECEP